MYVMRHLKFLLYGAFIFNILREELAPIFYLLVIFVWHLSHHLHPLQEYLRGHDAHFF